MFCQFQFIVFAQNFLNNITLWVYTSQSLNTLVQDETHNLNVHEFENIFFIKN